MLGWIVSAKVWLLPVGGYIAGLLTKPLQEEIGRRIRLHAEVKATRRDIYKELAWNIRLLMNDTWLTSHAIGADAIQSASYDKATESGRIHELSESAELRDCMEFFKSFRNLGVMGGTSMEKTLAMVGDSLLGLDYALHNKYLSVRLLKKVSRAKERGHIDKLMSDARRIRKEKEQSATDYLEKRKQK